MRIVALFCSTPIDINHTHGSLLCPMVPIFSKQYSVLSSPLFESIFFAFVKEVRLGGAEIDNLGTSIPALFQLNTLATIIGIGHTRVPTYDAASFVASVIALVANVHEFFGIDKGIADATQAIAWK